MRILRGLCFGAVWVGVLSMGCTHREAHSEKFQVALVLDKGGVDDKSFNASAYKGAVKARNELGIELRHVEVTDDAQIEPTLKAFAKKQFDLILSIGFSQREALTKASAAYPKARFAIVDSVVDSPNVVSLMFEEHEGSYLAGALAALKSKTGVIGFVGGMDNPLIRRFEVGYREGALKVNPKVKVISNFVGTGGDAWNNPTKGKELAISQISGGADVIYHAAGASGLGIFDAVEEASKKFKDRKFFAIGVDSNQNSVKPGLVLTSMLKRVDVAVYDTIRNSKLGKFTPGRKNYGLSNAGVDLAFDEFNLPLVDEKMKTELSKLRNDIQTSKIVVTDFYKTKGIKP